MRKIYILLTLIMLVVGTNDGLAQRRKYNKNHSKHRTTRVAKKKGKKSKKVVSTYKPTIHDFAGKLSDPRFLNDPTYDHGIDLSHYQGEVFWETVGENTKMAYVYLKATEGGDRIDAQYERNIEMAHRHGLKVGSYHFFRPKTPVITQLENFMMQCRPGEQDLIPMIDVETTGGLSNEEFCDSLHAFLDLVEQAYHQDFYFSQSPESIFVHASGGNALISHIRRSARYMRFIPSEALTNFFASFAHSLTHIEE